MTQEFFTIITQAGQARLTNAMALGEQIQITHLAVGSGLNNEPYTPTESQTALKTEVYRANVIQLSVDPDVSNQLTAEAVIPQNQGGFTIREAGLFTSDGALFAIAKFPETYKPEIVSGVASDLAIRFVFKTGNADQVELKIDPSIVLATYTFVTNAIANHSNDPDAHPNFLHRERSATLEAAYYPAAPGDPTITGNNLAFVAEDRSHQTAVVTKNLTIKKPAAVPAAGTMILQLNMNGTGGHSIGWDAEFKVAGKINNSPNAKNVCNLIFVGGNEIYVVIHAVPGA
ncbi:phage tail protein [Kiloniella sp. b19]|uniref:phage tail protein n=1 Tax=Kiloniella sp. GXU_MW_B19 TaxID=3141326 RepID=UPI0031D0D745